MIQRCGHEDGLKDQPGGVDGPICMRSVRPDLPAVKQLSVRDRRQGRGIRRQTTSRMDRHPVTCL